MVGVEGTGMFISPRPILVKMFDESVIKGEAQLERQKAKGKRSTVKYGDKFIIYLWYSTKILSIAAIYCYSTMF